MKEIDDFLQFIFENIEDKRIEFSKKIKYGHRSYTLTIHLKYPIDLSSGKTRMFEEVKSLEIRIDSRNGSIEIGFWENHLIFEDVELCKKWSSILEDHYQKNLISNFQHKINQFFDNVDIVDKDLGRSWKLRNYFEDDLEN